MSDPFFGIDYMSGDFGNLGSDYTNVMDERNANNPSLNTRVTPPPGTGTNTNRSDPDHVLGAVDPVTGRYYEGVAGDQRTDSGEVWNWEKQIEKRDQEQQEWEELERTLTITQTPIIDSYFVNYTQTHPMAHNKQLMLDTQRASYQTYLDQKAVIEKFNADSYAATQKAFRGVQATQYRASIAHLQDSQHRAQEFSLLSQDFRISAGQRMQKQGSEYAAAGVLMDRGGSTEKRLRQTFEEGERGAERLEGQAAEQLRRGKLLAQTTRDAAIEPEYIPRSMPAEVQDPDDPNSDLYKARRKLEREMRRMGFSTQDTKTGKYKVEQIVGFEQQLHMTTGAAKPNRPGVVTAGAVKTAPATQGGSFNYGIDYSSGNYGQGAVQHSGFGY